jgi:hypothetical protein
MLDDFQRWWKNFKKNVPKPFQDWAYKKGVAQAAEQRKKDAAGQYDKARQQHFDANKHYRDVKQQRDLAERKAKAAGATPQDKEVFDKADKELKKLEADLKKEFNETKAGQDAAKALHAAEKETAKAQKEADAAGKNLDPETKKFIEEQMKGDPPPTYWVPPS